MTHPIQIWTCADHHAAFRCGGWASVCLTSGQLTGAAGGERNTSLRRMELAGLAAALRDLSPVEAGKAAASVRIHTSSSELVTFAGFLADPERIGAPEDDLDLWARILSAAKGRRLELFLTVVRPGAPMAFAAAWADLAKEKAKTGGAFTAAIPRPNLAKIQGLGQP